MRRVLALILALALASPACAQIYPGYGTPTLLGDGTAAAPAYSFAGNAGVGFFRGSEGTAVGVAAAAAARVAFRASASSGMTQVLENVAAASAGAGGICWTSGTHLGIDGTCDRVNVTTPGSGSISMTDGVSGAVANVGGVLFLEANNVVQSAVSQNLHSYTVPANLMNRNGKALRVTALFLSVNNANAKAIGFVICGGSLTFNATASIAGALRATAYITRTAANTWTTSVTIEEGLASGTLTQAKLSGTYNSTPACTDTATNTINAAVNTAGATDTSSGFFMVEMLN